MRFRRLKLSGFKSFVEPAELRIEPGLTGIVGPNGCGKSNLLEAMRWVMGEGSPKSLRGGGMEDVIFAGTASRPARDFAEVSLLLDASDGPEHEVTRRIERGAGSAYRLDGRDVRQKDVALLFADAATGAHSPALVSQGRIGAIIAAKPAERRQMLEEAAGIAGLHARRKDAETKLRATETNLQRLDELLTEQESRIAALKRQARIAERYRQLTERIRLAEGRLIYRRWAEAEAAAKAAAAEASAASAEVAALSATLTRAQEAQVAGSGEVARRRAAAAAREQGQALAHQLATARARLDTVLRRQAELERLGQQLSAEQARETALREDAEQAGKALAAEQQAIAERLANGEAEAVRIARALGAAEAQARASEAALAGLLAREAAMKAERSVAEAALTAARGQAARIEEEARRLAAQLASLGDGASERAAKAAAEHKRAAAVSAQGEAEAALDVAEAQRGAAAERRDGAEAAVAAARAALAAAEAEHGALTRALATGGGRGVLADVRAAKGYERALAAALGDDLDAPVGNEGARFWGGAEALAGDPALPARSECLADHVEAPAALARRLAQVAVVEADDGRPLAVGQRLVTRGGLLRRWDGYRASGSGAAAAERLVRQNRLAEIGDQIETLRRDAAEAEAQRQALLDAVARARAAADEARARIAAAEREAREASRAEDVATGAIERLDSQRALLDERLTETRPVSEAAAAAVAQAENALAALPDAGLLAGSIAEARGQAAADGTQVAERRAEQATLARAAAADRERQATAARDQRAWAERATAAGQRIADAEARAAALAEERESLAAEPEALEEQIAGLEQQSRDSEAAVSATLAAEREAEAALAGLAAAFHQANEAMAAARERRAGADARAEAQVARRIEYGRVCGEKFECPPPLLPQKLGFDPAQLTDAVEESATLERLTGERERLGPVNLVAEQELAELDEARLTGAAERDELQEAINRLRGSIGSLNREGRVRLLDAYTQVDRHFRSLFTTLFDGGQAHLELIDSDDPLEAGLEIMAQPPGKRLTALTLLSGGEQALTAVALIFALFLTNPAPICVLDEVDAPLDDANVERFCDLLLRMTRETETRYLIVTHNAVTMSRMQRLYGVTMVEKGVSRLVSVDLGGAETLLAAE
ncbi:chromosome segregation protein SMC [Sphingomonas ginsengisoli (ex An et al. 2013)]|uniref:chromosome segregation protein SMC n=1 Tax=Sphingomonas ginsengisoli (ex An et al. 2013) TaxID=363835 RepID=UPI001269ABCA|nr:chromosome segregation protein SMC [Sphingomonas ginsengisoli An et al. 2013]